MKIFKRLPVRMVFEAGTSSVPPQLFPLNYHSETHLASKLNGMERRSYEDAVLSLNGLQTNSATVKESIGRTHDTQCTHVEETARYLEKIGVTLNDLDKLSVIHVAGTKGKGRCVGILLRLYRKRIGVEFIQMLHKHILNMSIGLNNEEYTFIQRSPHLLNVTERIRLNGEPISKVQFSQYFWKIYNILEERKHNADDMPPYFKFLTIMAYYVFLKEKVDVAIVEVGIGGEHDCTNIVRNTKTVGITSLGLEHTQLLGNTYRDIAWQKSGIIKSGSSVFSTHQNDECIPVLVERARIKNANLIFVPNFNEYKCNDKNALVQISANPAKHRNSSLAIQLSYDWIRRNPHKIKNEAISKYLNNSNGLTLPPAVTEALINCYWPGRCQTLPYKNMTLYIDGAHTIDSLQLCINWFITTTKSSSNKKCLLFNVTGDRNANEMLDLISKNVQFEEALFTPNISSLCSQAKDNMYTFGQPNRSQENSLYWSSLTSHNKSQSFSCITDIFKYLEQNYGDEKISILITGSLHLVGEVLRTIKN